MSEPLFDPRKAAGIIKQHLIEELHRLQTRILLVERFRDHAVTIPMLGRMGTDKPEQKMMQRHDELVAQIEALTRALDAASESALNEFVESLKRGGR